MCGVCTCLWRKDATIAAYWQSACCMLGWAPGISGHTCQFSASLAHCQWLSGPKSLVFQLCLCTLRGLAPPT